MNEELTNAERIISSQRRSIDALLSITKPEDGFPTVEKIAQKAIGVIRDITGFSTVTFRIYNPEEKSFKLTAQYGMTPEMIRKLDRVSDDTPIFAEIMERKEPALKLPLKFIQASGFKRTVFIPLVAGDITVGSIDLPTKTDFCPTDNDFRWYALIGRMLGSAIYQSQLMERLQSLAVIQERTHLSNELHDELAQFIRSVGWELEGACTSLDNEQLEQTHQNLDNIKTMLQNISKYLREEMLSLRECVDPDQPIIPILEEMLTRFERNWGIQTSLETKSHFASHAGFSLSPNEEIQIIRIIREALINIRRHANAQMVTIRMSEDASGMTFTILDDGIGFLPEDIPRERLGIRVMRERAASIGATVRIDSVEGAGTSLRIRMPHAGETAL